MKRDMDLVRHILMVVESSPEAPQVTNGDISLPGRSEWAVAEHVGLLVDAGLLRGVATHSLDDEDPADYLIDGLTWSGHDFLETVRSERVWVETKRSIAEKGGGMALEIVKAVATSIVKSSLGLSPG